MYFNAELKLENNIYLIESISRCLVSIHIPSGKVKIEAYLPWKYIEQEIGMLSLNQNIFIYSPVVNHLLVYNCLEQQIRTIELQGIEADKAGFYFSNILIYQGDFIVLPFKGKTIKIYGINGKLKRKDEKWHILIDKKYNYNKLIGNIRRNSACIIESQLFFSLVYKSQNYLCKYELNKEEHLCSIVYHSGEIPIRGVYAYPNLILFRRIFPGKTEIILIEFDSNEQKIIMINNSSEFEGDVYGDICHLKASFKHEILTIDKNNINTYQNRYKFKRQDVYIANGVLFNTLRNEILILDVDFIRKYSVEDITREIKDSVFYQEGYRKLFSGKVICERRYKLDDLIRYFIDLPPMMIEKKAYMEYKSIGKWIWDTI